MTAARMDMSYNQQAAAFNQVTFNVEELEPVLHMPTGSDNYGFKLDGLDILMVI